MEHPRIACNNHKLHGIDWKYQDMSGNGWEFVENAGGHECTRLWLCIKKCFERQTLTVLLQTRAKLLTVSDAVNVMHFLNISVLDQSALLCLFRPLFF